MKVSCLQENLAKGLGIVGRAVTNRSALPILSNIMLATDDGRLKLTATDLEIGINCWIGAKIEEEGAITVPARLLMDFVNSLPPERVDLKLDETTQTLNLKCARFNSNIKGIDAQEFPVVPTAHNANGHTFKINPSSLRAMIEQVVFAAATDESRPTLTGVLVQFNNDNLTMTAADSYRLSLKSSSVNEVIDSPIEIIIPARILAKLLRICTEQEQPVEVVVTPARKQVLFHMRDVDLVSQLIEGNFPDCNRIIPKSYTTRTVLETNALLKAVRISHLFTKSSFNIIKLKIDPSSDKLLNSRVTLTATGSELGDNVVDIDASIEGPEMEIAFNAKYLIDVLSVIDTPKVVIETTTASNPGVIRPMGDDNFTHVIMPMHITR
jgi:DNA polymerase-3 subunit beta